MEPWNEIGSLPKWFNQRLCPVIVTFSGGSSSGEEILIIGGKLIANSGLFFNDACILYPKR